MLDIIKKRRSIRKYQQKEVDDSKLNEILKAAMFSPSACHTRPWEFIIVKDKKTKDRLSQVTPWASFAKDAPVVLIVCADTKKAFTVEKSTTWIEDASIAAEHIYLETTNQGLGTCWIQIRGLKTDAGKDSEKQVRELLNVPEHIKILCLFPIGYPKEEKPEHSDSEYEEPKVHNETW